MQDVGSGKGDRLVHVALGNHRNHAAVVEDEISDGFVSKGGEVKGDENEGGEKRYAPDCGHGDPI
jgi:hypothetical protein